MNCVTSVFFSEIATEKRIGQTVLAGQQTLGHLELFSDYVRGPMANWIPGLTRDTRKTFGVNKNLTRALG